MVQKLLNLLVFDPFRVSWFVVSPWTSSVNVCWKRHPQIKLSHRNPYIDMRFPLTWLIDGTTVPGYTWMVFGLYPLRIEYISWVFMGYNYNPPTTRNSMATEHGNLETLGTWATPCSCAPICLLWLCLGNHEIDGFRNPAVTCACYLGIGCFLWH